MLDLVIEPINGQVQEMSAVPRLTIPNTPVCQHSLNSDRLRLDFKVLDNTDYGE